MWAVYILLGLLAVWLGILVIRALCFRPKPQPDSCVPGISFDEEHAISALQQLVQCRTVSHVDPQEEEEGEFEKLISLLPRLYPKVFESCSFQRLPDRGILIRWQGKSDSAPSVMMAHYDVVPADESQWEVPPFAGIIRDEVLWGRGTLDTKATLNGILCAAEHLISGGYQPDNDIYFAFSGGEEINGNGAKNIVDYFIEHGIQPALVLDEGGAVVENVFPGVKAPCGLIGIAEKGMMNVEYSVKSGGGHASAPPVHTPIRTLSEACLNIIRHPFPMKINRPAAELFDTLGRHSGFLYKLIFANLWCFRPALDLICRMSGGEINALVRTTTAFTQMEGSNARNVLPTQARMISNMRLNPGDTVKTAESYLKKTLGDDRVELHILESFEPSPVSETDCDAYRTVAAAVAQTWPGCIVSPYLMVQCSDARHYGRLSNHVYRFCAMELSTQERKTIHGNNERIRLVSITKAVEFYIRLMKLC